MSLTTRLLKALLLINSSAPTIIASPNAGTGSRRASVAIIIRLKPVHNSVPSNSSSTVGSPASNSLPLFPSSNSTSPPGCITVANQLNSFFDQPWVQDPTTQAEILFIKRATRESDRWSAHIAFPGGRAEPTDEDGIYTAQRECFEEVGIDLAEPEFLHVGALDDREITTSLGKRLLMILSPYVWLYTGKEELVTDLQEEEVASAHWIPLELLHSPIARYGTVGIDISSRLAPRSPIIQSILKFFISSMHFRCVLLPNGTQGELGPDLKLWGLTLGMTLDVLSSMASSTTAKIPPIPTDLALDLPLAPSLNSSTTAMTPLAPSLSSIFPRFSHWDINGLIWVFGWRYRRLLTLSKASNAIGGVRVNWAGMTLNSYYAAVRRALVVAVLMRAIAAFGAIGGSIWAFGRYRNRRLIKV